MAIFKLGHKCKVYHGTAGDTAETEIANVIEVNLNVESDQIDTSTRDSAWKTTDQGMKDATVDITILRKGTVQTGYDALMTSLLNGTPIALLILDGPSNVADSQGLDADFQVLSHSRPEPLADGVKISFTCKPTSSTRAPAWHDATGS